jgi:uncharacterized protein (TIGR04255 family)
MSEARRPADLPDFDSPPITETVFGVQYSTEHRVGLPELGLYAEMVKGEFPRLELRPPLGSWAEARQAPRGSLEVIHGAPPLPRCWFIDEPGNRLIQLQEDRFVHNWRKVGGDEQYPRYEGILTEFLRRWEGFKEFLEQRGKGRAKEDVFELSYINHIEKGVGWSDAGDLAGLFSFLSGRGTDGFLPSPSSIVYRARYALPAPMGYLEVSVNPVVRAHDQKEAIQLQLTSRGPSKRIDGLEVSAWFGLAREWIVKGFADLTSEEAHKIWGRRR